MGLAGVLTDHGMIELVFAGVGRHGCEGVVYRCVIRR